MKKTMEINKTLKAVVAALTLVAGGSVYATSTSEVHEGCCIAPIKWMEKGPYREKGSCISHGGPGCAPRGELLSTDWWGSGLANSNTDHTSFPPYPPFKGPQGRARGDEVRFDLANTKATRLSASGEIKLPQVGSFSLYELPFTPKAPEAVAAYGKLPDDQRVIRIIFASFNLENVALNPKGMLSSKMKEIIAAAKKNYPDAKSMLWVGRLLPKETAVTELAESLSAAIDLSQAAPLSYRTSADGTGEVDLPDVKDVSGNVVKGEKLKMDLAAIK